MRLALKSNVQLTNLQPEMIIAVLVFMGLVENITNVLTITSANDGKHKDTSRHYSGNALDFRTQDMWNTLSANQRMYELSVLRSSLTAALPGFDVVLESVNLPNEHMHIEWDPKFVVNSSNNQQKV